MRLRALREGIGLSQSKFADVIGSTQSSINRYENGQATPTVDLLRKYADYFDVSMDYIFARCDDPHGKLYEAKPPVDANNCLRKRLRFDEWKTRYLFRHFCCLE